MLFLLFVEKNFSICASVYLGRNVIDMGKKIILIIISKLNKQFALSRYFANVNFIIGSLLLACMICPYITSAQQQTFYCVTYYKILPGKESELQSAMENVDAKVQKERVNKGAISGWYLYKVLSPSGSSTEYDYVSITIVNRYKNIFETPYTFDSAFRKTFPGKDVNFFADYHSKNTALCKTVKEEIYTGLALADSSTINGFPYKYVVVDFMQPKPDKFGQYMKMELDTFRLVHKERIKLGDISQWACLQLALPYDTKTGYSFLALNFYNDLDNMTSSKYVEALRNIFPSVDIGNLLQSSAAMRDNPKADLMRLVLYASPKQ